MGNIHLVVIILDILVQMVQQQIDIIHQMGMVQTLVLGFVIHDI